MTNSKNNIQPQPTILSLHDPIFRQESQQYLQSIHLHPLSQSQNLQSKSKQSSQHISSNSLSENKNNNNHNFQKHSVITIKKLMYFKYNYSGTQQQKLAHLIWNIFMSSGIKNKKILIILFGCAKLDDINYLKIIKQYGFDEILKYKQDMIRKAQEILRKRFIQMVNQDVVKENLSSCRNIKLNHQFYVYFMELLNTIKAGPLVKMRINDKTAKKIEAIIKLEKDREEQINQ